MKKAFPAYSLFSSTIGGRSLPPARQFTIGRSGIVTDVPVQADKREGEAHETCCRTCTDPAAVNVNRRILCNIPLTRALIFCDEHGTDCGRD